MTIATIVVPLQNQELIYYVSGRNTVAVNEPDAFQFTSIEEAEEFINKNKENLKRLMTSKINELARANKIFESDVRFTERSKIVYITYITKTANLF